MALTTRNLPKRYYTFSPFVMTAAVLFFLYLVEILLIRNEHSRTMATDLTAPLVDLFAAIALGMAARQTLPGSRRDRLAWRMCFLAQLLYTAGDVIWMAREAFLGVSPFPSVADVFYFAFYPILFVGILLLADKRQSREDWIKKGVETGIILVASLLLYWNFLVGPLAVTQTGEPFFNQVLSLAYPTGDLLVLWALLVLVYNGSEVRFGRPVILLALGCLALVVSDSVFSFQTAAGTYASGGVADLGWIIQGLMFGLAGFAQVSATRPEEVKTRPVNREMFPIRLVKKSQRALPYMLLTGAFALLVASYLIPMPMNFFTIAGGVGIAVGLVILRQWMALAENTRLVNQLNLALDRVQRQATVVEKTNLELQREITERRRIERQLVHDALHDSLTGLPNRALFFDRVEHAIEYGKRHPENHFAVLFLDLDHFKVVNDSLGHKAGDDLLIAFGQRLQSCLRTSDTIARLGGDEFVVLLEDVHDEKSAIQAAERMLEIQSAPFPIGGKDVFTTISIGIVIQNGEYARAEDLLRDVDIAMYHAKEQGKACYALFSPDLHSKAVVRLELENELRRAIDRREFQLFYQPIYQLGTRQVTGFEALIRWNHPERGLLLPDSFLPVAEESNLIVSIGDWVLRQACEQMVRWHAAYPQFDDLTVNVNISSRQLSQPDFAEGVEGVLRTTGLKASALKLEITETAVIQNLSMANGFFDRLNRLGVQLQVDDFGTGYSSLSYLQHFPIHCIKIDRSFIQEIGKPGKNADLVRTMIRMAKDLGMEAIAEGIETREQLELLQSLSCQRGQGFLMSRPVDEVSAERIIQESSPTCSTKTALANEPRPASASKPKGTGSGPRSAPFRPHAPGYGESASGGGG